MTPELTNTIITVLGSLGAGAISAYATIRVAQVQANAAIEATRSRTSGEDIEIKAPKRRTWLGIALVTGLAAVSFIIATVVNVNRLAQTNKELSDTSQTIAQDDKFAQAAVQKGRPYVVNSIVSNVEIEDSKQQNGQWQRRAYVKTVYTLDILRDINQGEYVDDGENKDAFIEQYGINGFKRFRPWFGTEQQDLTVPGTSERNEFKLLFSAKKGSTYTVVTGGTYTYTLPLPADLPAPYLPGLRPNEDFYLYRNDEDYIKSLIIFIHSKTTKLDVAHRAAYLIKDRQPHYSEALSLQDSELKDVDQKSISARFSYLKPNMHGGILYRWLPQD